MIDKYAIFECGGKQYKVQEGQSLPVEKLENNDGDKVIFDKIILVKDHDTIKIGTPYVEGATIEATVEKHGRHAKIDIIKFKRRKHHMKQSGHKQHFTKINITKISA